MFKILKLIVVASRPIFWLASCFLFLIGFFYGSGSFDYAVFLQLFGFSFPGCFAIFAINDIFDYPSDFINPRKQNKNSFNQTLETKYHPLFFKLALFGAFFLILTSLFVQNPENFFLIVLILFLGFAYSIPPLRFKTRPFLEILTNVLGLILVFVIGYSHTNSVLQLFKSFELKIWLTMIFSLIGTTVFAFLADYEADKKVGDYNLIIFLGKKKSLFLLNLMYFLCIFLLLNKTIILVGIILLWLLTLPLWFFLENEKLVQKFYHLHIFVIFSTLTYSLFFRFFLN